MPPGFFVLRKMKYLCVFAAGFIAGVVLANIFGVHGGSADTVRVDTVRTADTVRLPSAKAARQVREVVRTAVRVRTDTVRLRDTVAVADTVAVRLPVVSKEYHGGGWSAWVSGVEPVSLDSVRTECVEVVKTVREGSRRWSVGIQAGAGTDGRRITPYVGIGVSWRLW